MNNEAITTAADHRAPPARPTLPDLGGGSGFSLHGVPPPRCTAAGTRASRSRASLTELSGEFLRVGV